MDPLLRSLIRLESALGSLTGPEAELARAETAELRRLIYRPADESPAEASTRNLSSRRHTERALQRALRTLEALVQNAPVAIMTVDRDFIVRMWNPAAEAALGWTADEVIGRPYPLVPPGHESEFEAMRMRVFSEPDSLHGLELRRQRKDGTLLDILLHSMVIEGTEGEPDLAVGFFVDVTERNQLESALRQSQKMDAVGRLAGGVAHDFNNLLTVIKGSVGMALLEAGGSPTLREDLQEIDRTADRATALTRQLLAFSRQQVVHPEVLELGSVVQQLEPMLRRLIGEDVSLRVSAEPGRVLADRSQIEQVLMNLAVNARDAMPEGGDLLITVRPAAFPAVAAEGGQRAPEGSGAMRLTVSDTGVGMDTRTLQQIFEPFFTTKAPGRGTGLGLSMVYGIVRQNGGQIAVDSEPGAGTTVSIQLPATARAMAAPGEVAPPAVPAGGDARVMVVEDEPALRALARRVLMGAGYQVLTAENGADALERLAEAGGVDLVLTDVVMPVMGGRELVDRLRERPGAPAVLYMSGYAESEIVHRGVLRDGSRLLEKPFTPAELLEAVRATLDEARRAR